MAVFSPCCTENIPNRDFRTEALFNVNIIALNKNKKKIISQFWDFSSQLHNIKSQLLGKNSVLWEKKLAIIF